MDDFEHERALYKMVTPFFGDKEGEAYRPRGCGDVTLAEVTVVPDDQGEEVRALRAVSAHLVRLLHWMRRPQPGSVVAKWDATLTDEKPDGTGIASSVLEEVLAVVLANVEALAVLLTAPRSRFLGPISVATTAVPESATAAHYRAVIEASATFIWVTAAEDDSTARRRIVGLIEQQREALDTVDGSMREAVDAALDEVVQSALRRWFYTADGNKNERQVLQGNPQPGLTARVKEVLSEDAVRAYGRLSNATHGNVLWSQLLLQRPADVAPEPGDFWSVMSSTDDREKNLGMVFSTVRELFASAARVLEGEHLSD